MIQKCGFENEMPESVPPQCRSCPIRNWAEFFRGLGKEGQIIADSLHEVLGQDCIGAGDVERSDGHVRWRENICQQPDVLAGDFGGIIEAHFTEAGMVMSGQLLLMIANQTTDQQT